MDEGALGLRRDSWENSRDNRWGEDRYTWDPRHWNGADGEDRDRRGEWDEADRPHWMRAVESFFLRLVVLGLVALVLVQLWQRGSVGQWLQLSQFEGNILTPEQRQVASGTSESPASDGTGLPATAAEPLLVTVTLVNAAAAPEARILVGGAEAGRFNAATVTVAAPTGAQLRIDPGKDARQLTFRITALSERDRLPRLGTQVTTRGSAVVLGQVN